MKVFLTASGVSGMRTEPRQPLVELLLNKDFDPGLLFQGQGGHFPGYLGLKAPW
jgi:hypothetical protein